jgi:hypothetical protein
MEEKALITCINNEMGLDLPPQIQFEEIRRRLQAAVSSMIENDFQKLVNILYRVDVNERKLKYLLQENVGSDADIIIADLIIERQIEKIKLRSQYSRRDDEISEEDRW